MEFWSSIKPFENEIRAYFKEELKLANTENIEPSELKGYLLEGLFSTDKLKSILSPYSGLDIEIKD